VKTQQGVNTVLASSAAVLLAERLDTLIVSKGSYDAFVVAATVVLAPVFSVAVEITRQSLLLASRRRGIDLTRVLGKLAVLTVLLVLGCAHAHSPGCSTWALGKDALAACYGPLPVPVVRELPDGAVRVEERTQEIDRTFPARDEKRHTTITTPAEATPAAVASSPPLLQESRGASISETAAGVMKLAFTAIWTGIKWFVGIP
jgi:hypothetical protein